MSIQDSNGWSRVEQIARQHELNEADHYLPVKPVPMPTVDQNLAWALTDLAKCKARLLRIQGKALEVIMWLDAQEVGRAREAVNAIALDL